MINLLPPAIKSNLRFSRRNSYLLSYCITLVAVMIGMLCITMAGLFYMDQSRKSLAKQVEITRSSFDNRQLEKAQAQAEEISGNIKLTTSVLSKQILFSKLITQIGSVMPANTSLSDLKIDKGERGISLTAIAANYTAATQVQVNLSDPGNKIFEKADLISATCDQAASDPRYPCTVVIRALFGDNKSYLFINPDKKAKQ